MLPNGSRFVEHVEAPFATVEELGFTEECDQLTDLRQPLPQSRPNAVHPIRSKTSPRQPSSPNHDKRPSISRWISWPIPNLSLERSNTGRRLKKRRPSPDSQRASQSRSRKGAASSSSCASEFEKSSDEDLPSPKRSFVVTSRLAYSQPATPRPSTSRQNSPAPALSSLKEPNLGQKGLANVRRRSSSTPVSCPHAAQHALRPSQSFRTCRNISRHNGGSQCSFTLSDCPSIDAILGQKQHSPYPAQSDSDSAVSFASSASSFISPIGLGAQLVRAKSSVASTAAAARSTSPYDTFSAQTVSWPCRSSPFDMSSSVASETDTTMELSGQSAGGRDTDAEESWNEQSDHALVRKTSMAKDSALVPKIQSLVETQACTSD